MQYLGGKSRTARQIAGYLNLIRKPGQPYWEPFVGAGWILERIRGTGPNFASDANAYLIAMWQALQKGWEPPGAVTEAEYRAIKEAPDSYPPELVAFVGFGCSFGGKWFAGYARGNTSPRMVSRSPGRKVAKIPDTAFFCGDFLFCPPPAHRCLIYCDPPYDDQTAYGAVGQFDTAAFWRHVRYLEERGHTVIVSEYAAPGDFAEVVTIPTKTEIRTAANGRENRIERLFRLGNHAPLQPSLFAEALP